MLSLGMQPGEYLVIGENIVIQVVSVDGALRLAIDAPREVPIERGDHYELTRPAPTCIQRLRKKGEMGKIRRRA